MKREPFFLIRWWRSLTLQTRLFLAFSILLGFSVLALSLFLNNVIRTISINQRTQAAYERNREAQTLKATISQYQLALLNYENNPNSLAEEKFQVLQNQIQQDFSALSNEITGSEKDAQLAQFEQSTSQLVSLTPEIVQAVDNEDSTKVLELQNQANGEIDKMNQVADAFRIEWLSELKAVETEAQNFQTMADIVGFIMIPIFLLLAGLTALIIYREINGPLEQLSQASDEVRKGTFQPSALEHLTNRGDEVGAMARMFVRMATTVNQRSVLLRQEADAIRAKIR